MRIRNIVCLFIDSLSICSYNAGMIDQNPTQNPTYYKELKRKLDLTEPDAYSPRQHNDISLALQMLTEDVLIDHAKSKLEAGYLRSLSVGEIAQYICDEFESDPDLVETAVDELEKQFGERIASDLELMATYLAGEYVTVEQQREEEKIVLEEDYDESSFRDARVEVDEIVKAVLRDFKFDTQLLFAEITQRKAEFSPTQDVKREGFSTIPMA